MWVFPLFNDNATCNSLVQMHFMLFCGVGFLSLGIDVHIVNTRVTDVGCCRTKIQLRPVLEEHCPSSDHALAVCLFHFALLYLYTLMFTTSLVPPQIVLLCKVEISTRKVLVMVLIATQHPAVRDYDLSHVKYCMSGAAPLSGELIRQVTKILPNARIGQGYGQHGTTFFVVSLA
jgi:Acyl-CoA synthetases (AMP-forming)/AMP-acid ligases II